MDVLAAIYQACQRWKPLFVHSPLTLTDRTLISQPDSWAPPVYLLPRGVVSALALSGASRGAECTDCLGGRKWGQREQEAAQ